MTGLGLPPSSAEGDALLAALPVLFDYRLLHTEERLTLRATCRGFRDAHDRVAHGLSLLAGRTWRAMLTHAQPFQPVPGPEAVRASIRGFISRGCRPRRLNLLLPWTSDAELAEQQACALFESAAPAGSVTTVCISTFTPITSAVAAAVASIGPRLTELVIAPEDAESLMRDERVALPPECLLPPPPEPAEQEAATVGAELLLQRVGPQLTKLWLRPDRSQRFFPRRALTALSHCTALRELMLSCTWPAEAAADGLVEEMRLLDTLSRLPLLRALDLSGGVAWLPPASQRMSLTTQLEACLSRMTGLTSLKLHLYHLQHFHNTDRYKDSEVPPSLDQQLSDLEASGMLSEAVELRAAAEAEWCAVVSATRHMRNLVELKVPLQADAADLAGLTTLTCLRVGALKLPVEAAAAAVGNGGGGRLPHYALPPELRRLETNSPLPMHVVASLEPSPPPPGKPPCSLIAGGRLWGELETPWCLAFDRDADVDERERLTLDAVAEAKRAISVLAQLGFREQPMWQEDSIRGLLILAYSTAGNTFRTASVWPPLPPGESVDSVRPGSHVASWMGGLAALRLERLALGCLVLPSRDMLGIARCMPGLTSLDLCGSSYTVSSLALLAGMQRLEVLAVDCRDWDWPLEVEVNPLATHFWEQVVQSAFLALTLASPPPDETRGGAAEGCTVTHFAMPLPRLQLLEVGYEDGMPSEALERALEAARQELAVRDNGAKLELAPR